jgi:glutathione S-transferase
MLDRVFDNAVMNVMQRAVWEYLFRSGGPDADVLADVRQRLQRSYGWLENWLATYPLREGNQITLIECAAAPSLFYADWVEQ